MAIGNKDGWTPLNSAVACGHIEVIELLLNKGANLTVVNNAGLTPLNLASNNGHIDVLNLLEKGADVLALPSQGFPSHNIIDNMSSWDRSTSSGSGSGSYLSSGYSTVVRQDIIRTYKSRNRQSERIERTTSNGRLITYNHHARGYEKDAPCPS
ncbi:ankyrin repeat-containing domain protein [Xylaria bambusicola]|uniref:ankyrin repeat-containing domain protein n=1 Tax=Xylaria bambusicola TaxID=326684 RepID=UPI002008C16E|nr:ankyrin repeat-containing domain protein [Xylaria bambusicola]KAI0509465.1 ankyrin repeat-containing domain protein [Xylaria bambusicola]